MLMGAHDGAVDHRIFVVGVCGEMPKHPLPHTSFGPAAEPQVDLCPVADNEYAMIDSTIVRAHQHSAGAQKKLARTKQSGARAAD